MTEISTRPVALITGGSRGIGLATALALTDDGFAVSLVARGEESLGAAKAQVFASGGFAHTIVADVSQEATATAAVRETIETFGRLDVVVNNVGGSLGSGSFAETDLLAFKAVMDLNFSSAVYVSHAATHFMKDHGGGCILHVSSICGRELCLASAYVAAKAAMIGLGKEMAVSLAKHKIRVNTIAPGSIFFEGGSWQKRQEKDPARIEKMLKDELPWGRFGTAEEVANVIAFLASPKASWVTGSCVVVDGAQGRAF